MKAKLMTLFAVEAFMKFEYTWNGKTCDGFSLCQVEHNLKVLVEAQTGQEALDKAKDYARKGARSYCQFHADSIHRKVKKAMLTHFGAAKLEFMWDATVLEDEE